MGCEKQLTVDQESFRNHTMAKIAGQLNGGKENMCKANVRKGLEDGLAMRLPLSEPREIYKDNLEKDNRSNIGSEFNFEIDLPGKRDRSTIYRLNLIKLYRRKPELANLVTENSSEGIDSETLYSMLINSLREDTEYLLDLGVNGMGQSNRTLPVVWLEKARGGRERGDGKREEKRRERERGDGKREEKESGEREEPALDGEKGLVRDWSGKTMNARGVENGI
ncbi:uncharacterized protein TNCV_2419581 [Trichonephila clavipes]|nr:uncharacterized protein TNCV_2419581 [Trichonephila clavipes]